MISLKEIIHSVEEEKKSGLINVEDWTLTETDYLSDIGFKPNGDFAMGLENPPLMVFRKEDGFHLKDGKKKTHLLFKKFEDMMEHFDSYEQKLKHI